MYLNRDCNASRQSQFSGSVCWQNQALVVSCTGDLEYIRAALRHSVIGILQETPHHKLHLVVDSDREFCMLLERAAQCEVNHFVPQMLPERFERSCQLWLQGLHLCGGGTRAQPGQQCMRGIVSICRSRPARQEFLSALCLFDRVADGVEETLACGPHFVSGLSLAEFLELFLQTPQSLWRLGGRRERPQLLLRWRACSAPRSCCRHGWSCLTNGTKQTRQGFG